MMLQVRETPSGSVNNACHLDIGLWKLPPVVLLLAVRRLRLRSADAPVFYYGQPEKSARNLSRTNPSQSLMGN